ncbi:MAG: ABC transporter substrate-binding protein [Caldilineaceae bacterium]
MVSYTSSPPADVLYATDGRTEPASVNINPDGGVFRQIEFIGIVRGTEQLELAQQFVDFLLSEPFQADMPLQMFVYPVLPDTPLPELFTQLPSGQPIQCNSIQHHWREPRAVDQRLDRSDAALGASAMETEFFGRPSWKGLRRTTDDRA